MMKNISDNKINSNYRATSFLHMLLHYALHPQPHLSPPLQFSVHTAMSSFKNIFLFYKLLKEKDKTNFNQNK